MHFCFIQLSHKTYFCHLYMPNNAVGGHWCVLGENCELFSVARKGRPNHFERAPVKSLLMLTLLHFGGFVLLYLGISLLCAIAVSWDHTHKSCNRDFSNWKIWTRCNITLLLLPKGNAPFNHMAARNSGPFLKLHFAFVSLFARSRSTSK